MYCFVSYRYAGTKLDVRQEQVLRGLECSCVRTSGNSSAYICFKLMVLAWEESTLLTYAWAWKTNLLSIQGPGGFSLSDCGGPVDNDSASWFVWHNLCHRSTESFFEENYLVKWKDSMITTIQVQTVTKDGTRAQPTRWSGRMK